MKRILISLLSKYLQPNFLFIKEMEGRYDKLVFITSKGMEEKGVNSTHYLCKALGILQNNVNVITVIEDDANDILSKLKNFGFITENKYLINLTGGTKVMSLTVHDFFHSFMDIEFAYIPEGKNIIKKLYSTDPPVKLNYRMNLIEYFTINRLKFTAKTILHQDEKKTNELFEQLRNVGFIKNKIKAMKTSQMLPNPTARSYYSGVWFEEYVYYRLKRENNISDDSICTSAGIYHDYSDTNNNEIDVMFVKNNNLFIFECKLSLNGTNGNRKDTIDAYMYKLAAIAKDFGLKVNSYILTLHNESSFSQPQLDNIQKKLHILGLKKVIFSNGLCNSHINLE